MKKYALLDTDFISKTFSVNGKDNHHLIDCVLDLPEYEFYCHEQILNELGSNAGDAPAWLKAMIGKSRINSFSDEKILDSLADLLGSMGCLIYSQLLKSACD